MTKKEHADLKVRIAKANILDRRIQKTSTMDTLLDALKEGEAAIRLTVTFDAPPDDGTPQVLHVEVPITNPNVQSLKQILKRIERDDSSEYKDL